MLGCSPSHFSLYIFRADTTTPVHYIRIPPRVVRTLGLARLRVLFIDVLTTSRCSNSNNSDSPYMMTHISTVPCSSPARRDSHSPVPHHRRAQRGLSRSSKSSNNEKSFIVTEKSPYPHPYICTVVSQSHHHVYMFVRSVVCSLAAHPQVSPCVVVFPPRYSLTPLAVWTHRIVPALLRHR